MGSDGDRGETDHTAHLSLVLLPGRLPNLNLSVDRTPPSTDVGDWIFGEGRSRLFVVLVFVLFLFQTNFHVAQAALGLRCSQR